MKTITRLFWGILLFPYFLQGQTVTTLATNTGIDDALILDEDYNLYGANYMGESIFKRTPDGTISIFSSGFNTPNGMAFNSAGELFMVDNQGNRVYKILPNGISEDFVPNINNPSGLISAYDSDTLIVTSYAGGKLMKIAPDGSYADFPGTNIMNGPVGLAYDEDNNLYVAEFGSTSGFGSRKIFKITPAGEVSQFAQLSGGGSIGFIAYAKGYLYATLIYDNTIRRIDMDGNSEIWLGSTPGTVDGNATSAKFNGPNGILATPSQDTLLVSDFNTRNLRMITDLDVTTKINELEVQLEVAVYPNPVSDTFSVKIGNQNQDFKNADFKLYDAVGKVVLSEKINTNNSLQINRSADWAAGIYFYEIVVDEKPVAVGKVVLE